MESIDLSASRCYPLELPNLEEKDERLKLNCRTGASVCISNSQILVYGGLTEPLALSPDFLLEDVKLKVEEMLEQKETTERSEVKLRHLVSPELFGLSLIDHRWRHFSGRLRRKAVHTSKNGLKSDFIRPGARLYASIAVKEPYVYMCGGIGLEERSSGHKKVVRATVKNDLWRYSVVSERWRCIYRPENETIAGRFDGQFIYKPTNNTLMLIGGCNSHGSLVQTYGELDLDTLVWTEKPSQTNLKSRRHGGEFHHPVLRNTRTAILSRDVDEFPQEIVVYDPASKFAFSEYETGSRIRNCDEKRFPRLEFPQIGNFGENIFVSGFSPQISPASPRKVSAYVHNMHTHEWMQIRTRCMHKRGTHVLSSGFVWESHHTMVFLGARMPRRDVCTAPSVQFFDLYLYVPLASTCAFGLLPSKGVGKMPAQDDVAENTVSQETNPEIRRFVEYAQKIAPRVRVSSIPPVFPAEAVALSKNAFERKHSFADFEFVCSNGTSIPVPLIVCRRRWGKKFDLLLCEAYSWSYSQSKLPVAYAGLHGTGRVTTGSFTGSSTGGSGFAGYGDAATGRMPGTPHFRHPFQSTGTGTSSWSSRVSSNCSSTASPLGGRSPAESRRNSSSLDTLHQASYPGSHQASPRRRSIGTPYNPTAGHHSPVSSLRRASLLTSLAPPAVSLHRSGSLGTHPPVEFSRDRHMSVPSLHFSPDSPFADQHGSPGTSRGSPRGTSPGSSPPGSPGRGQVAPQITLLAKDLPQPSPMPAVDSTGKPLLDPGDSSKLLKLPNSSEDSAKRPSGIKFQANALPPQKPMPPLFSAGKKHLAPGALTPLPASQAQAAEDQAPQNQPSQAHLSSARTRSARVPSASPSCLYASEERPEIDKFAAAEQTVSFPVGGINSLDLNLLPRALYLPYSRPTVEAFVEYLCTGQVGTKWRIFPTATELLLLAKHYDIPLLYDLVLELLFAVLAKKKIQICSSCSEDGQDTQYQDNHDEHHHHHHDPQAAEWPSVRPLYLKASRYTNACNFYLDPKLATSNDDQPLSPRMSPASPSGSLPPSPSTSPLASPRTAPSSSSNSDSDGPVKTTFGFLDPVGYSSDDSFEDAESPESHVHKHWPTLKELVAPDSHPCSDKILDVLVEVGALINDMKLMLDALAVKEMSDKLHSQRKSVDPVK